LRIGSDFYEPGDTGGLARGWIPFSQARLRRRFFQIIREADFIQVTMAFCAGNSSFFKLVSLVLRIVFPLMFIFIKTKSKTLEIRAMRALAFT